MAVIGGGLSRYRFVLCFQPMRSRAQSNCATAMTDDQARYDARAMADYRRDWKRGLAERDLRTLMGERDWWEGLIVAVDGRLDQKGFQAENIAILEELDARIGVLMDRIIRQGEKEHPLAEFVPTWEQAVMINSWSPEYEPEAAPEGYRSVVNFGGKRSLKTCATVISAILWMVPNCRDWRMFGPLKDQWGRGTYTILRRPMFEYWRRHKRMVFDDHEPPVQDRLIWHGCSDENAWKKKLEPEYRKRMPMQYVRQRGKDLVWNITDRYFETKWGTSLVGMLYKSDIQSWGGQELHLVCFDEGPPRQVVKEVISRTKYISWAYTPAEEANTVDRIQVAREVYDGELQLVGRTKVIKSHMMKVPDAIIPDEEKNLRYETLSKLGEEGRVALEGGFFDSSPRVFDLFVRERHVLPVGDDTVSRAIRDKLTPDEKAAYPWLEKFRGANILRGFDEGIAHPSACVWVALLQTGELVVFREWSKTQTSIADRCEMVVRASGNELVTLPWIFDEADKAREEKTGQKVIRRQEKEVAELIRKTFADPKLWKKDPTYPMETWADHYRRGGLKIEKARLVEPDQRCNFTNGLFRANPSRRHLNPAQATEQHPYGYDLYITDNCTKLILRIERYLWEQLASGIKKGELSGKPDTREDDLVDSLCYSTGQQIRWVDNEEIRSMRTEVLHAA